MAEKAKIEEPVEEASLFDEAEVSEELVTDGEEAPEEEEAEEINITISDESPAAKKARLGEKKEADGRELTIKSVFHTKPRIRAQDGSMNEPKKTQSGDKEYYPGKLGIKFEEDDLVEYYPSFHYFVNDGKVSTLAKINRGGENEITKLFKLAVPLIGKPEDEISDKEFYEFLVGKKVKISTSKGKFQGKTWFRNDIVAFL